MGNNTKIVLLDVDNTLIKGQSQKIFLNYLFKKKLLSFHQYIKIMLWFFLYKLNLIKNPKKIAEYAFKLFKAKDKKFIENISKNFFEEELKNYFYQEAIQIVEEHKKKKRKIILVSNSIDIIIKEVAKYLKIETYICTTLEIKKNIYTGKIKGEINYGKNKIKKINEKINEKKFTLSESWGYSDHISDIFMLKLVKYPIVVNPNKIFEKEAHKRGWKILKFKK